MGRVNREANFFVPEPFLSEPYQKVLPCKWALKRHNRVYILSSETMRARVVAQSLHPTLNTDAVNERQPNPRAHLPFIASLRDQNMS